MPLHYLDELIGCDVSIYLSLTGTEEEDSFTERVLTVRYNTFDIVRHDLIRDCKTVEVVMVNVIGSTHLR